MAAVTTEQGVVQATRVADYVFTSPKPWKTFPVLFVLSLVLGAIVGPVWDWQRWLTVSLGLFFVPSALAALLAVPLARGMGGIIYMRRSTLLALLSLIVLAPLLLVWRLIIGPFFAGRVTDIILFGWALVMWLWHLVLLSTSHASHARSLPVALVMPVSGVAMMAVLAPLGPFGLREVVLACGFLAVFLLSAAAFRKMAESPLRRNFKASGMELVRNMLSHWTEGGDAGKKEMEEFFSTFSVDFSADIGILAFRSGERIRGLWLVPSVHPGPFGTLGGSDLPGKLRKELPGEIENLMVFHGAATHDQNPASDGDVQAIAAAVREGVDGLSFCTDAGPLVRFRGERVAVCAQPLGRALVAVHTSAPDPTDDIDHAVGKMVEGIFERQDYTPAIFIDAHNCLERGGGAVHSGSFEAGELLRRAQEAAASAPAVSHGLRAGFASVAGFSKEKDGIGAQGIQVAVIEAGGKKAAYILFDGNNMVKGLREKVLEAVKGMVDEAEVFTTDNHCVHATMGGYNPVGAKYSPDELARKTKGAVDYALAHMEYVEVGAASVSAKIHVFGPGNTARLTTAINSTVAILRTAVTLCLLGAFLGAFALFYFVNLMG
jgi:putative membrane protein